MSGKPTDHCTWCGARRVAHTDLRDGVPGHTVDMPGMPQHGEWHAFTTVPLSIPAALLDPQLGRYFDLLEKEEVKEQKATGRSCPTHKSYKTGRPPTSDCMMCWAAYGRRRAIDDGLRSQGKKFKKPNGRASKAKGRQAVLDLRSLMLGIAPWLEEDDILVKATSMSGVDLHLSPAASRWCPYGIEVKSVEQLSVWAAFVQAAANAKAEGKTPVVFFKRNGTPLYVMLTARDFLTQLPWPKDHPRPTIPPPETPAPMP